MIESLKKAQKKYQKETVKSYTIRLNRNKDADILNFLEEKKNVQGYIKSTLREKIAGTGTD